MRQLGEQGTIDDIDVITIPRYIIYPNTRPKLTFQTAVERISKESIYKSSFDQHQSWLNRGSLDANTTSLIQNQQAEYFSTTRNLYLQQVEAFKNGTIAEKKSIRMAWEGKLKYAYKLPGFSS